MTMTFGRELSSRRTSGLIRAYAQENKIGLTSNLFPDILEDEIFSKMMRDPNFWISQELEEKIIFAISQSLDISGILYHLGTESLITNAYDLLPMDNSKVTLEELIHRIPILINRLTRTVSLNVEILNSKLAVFQFEYLHRYTEKWYDAIFFQGMLNGLAVLFELKEFNIQMTKTKLYGIHVTHKDLGPDIQFGADTNEYHFQWKDEPYQLSRSTLNKDDLSNRHKVMMVSKGEDTSEELSFVDVGEVVKKSRELAIENRDLEAAVEILKSFKYELEKKQLSIAKDLKLAKNIQKGLIPQIIPDWKGIQFWAAYSPMQEVSGDYYDYFPFQSDRLGIVVCDVSGHGVPAAFITALSKMLFTNYKYAKPSESFKHINRDLLDLVKQQGYTTCVYALIERDYRIVYSIAGHPRPILFRHKTGKAEIQEGEGTFLGMFPDGGDTYRDHSLQLEPGDKLFLYTDGITEAENDRGESFGEERLISLIEKTKDLSIQDSIESIINVHKEFTMGTDPMDDITLLGFQLSPRLPEFNHHKELADKHYKRKNFKDACDEYKKAHEILPRELITQLAYGKALANAGKYDEAILLLETYNRFKTNNYLSHAVLGFCYYKVSQFEKAELEWKKAHSLNDDNLSILFNLAKVYEKLGQRAKLKEMTDRMKRIEASFRHILPLEKKWESMLDE
ncbi:serine phosphatase RsbU [Leptospira ryugenii]|uniref:Serine phosphatase RsbU n=1 Tax=Leptospira ryugenii TaxID=1917863 RepID=A0A2P2E2G5_9LEPT|nr:PP2C family protein-serine/threonine phosphatase [Leptospira ryugenii]GBF51049.1 serine phosphatase RsbU [Leptospira ryugenii]